MSLRKRLLRRESRKAFRTWLSTVETESMNTGNKNTFATTYKFYPKSGGRPVEICIFDIRPLPKQICCASIYRRAYKFYCDISSCNEMIFCTCLLWSKSYMRTIK